MAETETSDGSKNVIKIEEEIDGDQFGTMNYCFSKIGEPVPIKSDADFKYDLDSLPSRPLEVSKRFIFVAHSTGFCVAKIKDVRDAAEGLQNGVKGPCIQVLSVADVPLGKVSILALSADSSMLAASVGPTLYFFSVDGFLHKDHEPSFTKSLNGSSCIKDMQWSPRLKDQFVVLTRDGDLYRGAGKDDLCNLMDSVDAVNWSKNGKFLAVARYDYLSILSSKFEEKLRIKLLFDSLVEDDPDCVVKVDSIKWVRPDCIMLGCYTLSADGNEENNLIQLISVKDGNITNPSSNPVALNFRDAFLSISEDDIPSGSGPYTFMSYLDEFELAFVANKKSTDQHIVVFNWSPDKENGAEMVEILKDAWLPRIHLQVHNDADNMIVGLAIIKVDEDEKTILECGDSVDKKVLPCCILMCLTIDGYFSMLHFASAIGPSASLENLNSASDEEQSSSPISYQQPVINIDNNEKQIVHNLQPQKVKVNEPSVTQQDVPVVKPDTSRDEGQSLFLQKKEDVFEASSFKASQPVNSVIQDLQPQKVKANEPSGTQQDFSIVKPNNSRDERQSPFSQRKEGGFEASPFNASQPVNSVVHDLQPPKVKDNEPSGTQQDVSIVKPNNSSDEGKSPFSQKIEGGFETALFKEAQPVKPVNQDASVKTSANSVSKSAIDKPNKTLFGDSTELSANKTSLGLQSSSGTFPSRSPFSSNVLGAQSFSSSGSFSSGGLFSLKASEVKSPQPPHFAVQEKRSDTTAGTTLFSSGSQKFSFPKMTSGPSTSSNLLPQGTSTGTGFAKSLPVTNARSSTAKSSDLKFSNKGNIRNQTSSRLINAEPNLSEQRSVEEMAKELDALLDSIEGPGGFYDASVAAHKSSVAALEEGILLLSERCQNWTDTMHQGTEEVQRLLDKTVQVLARKIYMEAIVKQATDSQYLDIWNRQKLSSELDMKRRHILEINQNLTTQLIELERHLNTLELQRFGDKSDVHMNRKSFHTKHGPPRHVQSLQSLHNTMNAQLTAAEKLSECLSKQMAVLKIETEPVKKQNVKKELFETIGISDGPTTFSSPGQGKAREIPPKGQHLMSSYSTAVNTDMKKSQLGTVKNFEPETARRRRDSLDKNWASIEPPKTTVKRMLLQEDHQMTPAKLSLPTSSQKINHRLPERSVVSYDTPHRPLIISQSRGSQDVQIKQQSEGESNSSLWGNYHSGSLKATVMSVPPLGLGSQSKSTDLTTEISRSRSTFTSKSGPVAVDEPKVSQQTKSLPEPTSNIARAPSLDIFQKKPTEYSESSSKNADGKQSPLVAETSSIWSKKSLESPFSGISSASSSTAFSGKSFSLGASTKESQLSTGSLSVPVNLAPSSFSFKDSTSSSTSATSLGKSSTGFGFKLGATQNVPPSGPSSLPSLSISSFPSTTTASSSVKPSVNIEFNTSKVDPPKLNSDTSESSKPQVVSVPKFDLKQNESSSGHTSPLQTAVSAPAVPTSQTSTTFSVNQLNLSAASGAISSAASGATSSTVVVSDSKPELPSLSPVVSSPAVTNPIDGVVREIDTSDPAVTQEDEMEEEAPDTAQLTLGNLGGFALGSSPNPSAPKQNPFGAPFGNPPANTPITSFAAAPPSGSLFKPASFNVESQQPSQPPQQSSFGAFSSGFGSNNNQSSGGQGFGQPSRIGSGQQALGSVLGSFGQSRQFGAGLPGSVASASPFGGGFATAASSGGGFANLASGGGGFGGLGTGGGGFAAAATGGGGFAAAATGGGGFAAAATGGGGFGAAPAAGGGFAALAPGGGFGGASAAGGGFGGAPAAGGGFGGAPAAGGGFAGAPAAGGGFGGAASGGFGGFSSQGGSGFSTFGSTGGTGRPPSELFTQMRK